jgi:hypothetical protein
MKRVGTYLSILLFLCVITQIQAALDDVILGYHPYEEKAPIVIRDAEGLNYITGCSGTIEDHIDALVWLDSGMIASGSAQGNLRLYDSSLALLDTVSSLGQITGLGALSGNRVAVSTKEGSVYVYSITGGSLSQLSSRTDTGMSYIDMAIQSTDHIVLGCWGTAQHLKRVTDTLANAGGANIPNTDANSLAVVALSDDRVAVSLDDQQTRIISADMGSRLAYYKDGTAANEGWVLYDITAQSNDTLVLAYNRADTGYTRIRLRGGETLGEHIGIRGFPGEGQEVAVLSNDDIVWGGYGGAVRTLDGSTLDNILVKGFGTNGDTFGSICVQGAAPISIVNPTDRVVAGAFTDIQWQSNSSAGDNVKIEFSRDSGNTWALIADSTANSGAYRWAVPNITGNECILRITEDAYGNVANSEIFEVYRCAVPDLSGDCISGIDDISELASQWLKTIDN